MTNPTEADWQPAALRYITDWEYDRSMRQIPSRNKLAVGASAAGARIRKAKFQADLAPSEDAAVRLLKEQLELSSNTDFLSDALTLFLWAVSERKLGHRILSESDSGERRVLVFPRLERVAPVASEHRLPRVDIKWTDRELGSLARLVSKNKAGKPTGALIRAVRG